MDGHIRQHQISFLGVNWKTTNVKRTKHTHKVEVEEKGNTYRRRNYEAQKNGMVQTRQETRMAIQNKGDTDVNIFSL